MKLVPGAVVVFIVLGFTGCAHGARAVDATATPGASASEVPNAPATPKPPLSFPAARIGSPGTPALTERQLRLIRAVRAASTRAERPNLIVSVFDPDNIETSEIILFYGNPRFPDGVIPPGGDPRIHAAAGNVPVATVGAYHVIGQGCNTYYRPSTGETFAVPGDGAGCATWKPSAADRAAQHFAP